MTCMWKRDAREPSGPLAVTVRSVPRGTQMSTSFWKLVKENKKLWYHWEDASGGRRVSMTGEVQGVGAARALPRR